MFVSRGYLPWITTFLVLFAWLATGRAWGQQPAATSWPESPVSRLPPTATTYGENTWQESLEDAWQVALASDQRVQANRWNVASAESTLSAAEAERYPSMKLGGQYYALSERPTFAMSLGPLAVQTPIADQNALGARAIVSQPLYTSGRITSGINAANENVCANQFDLERTRLDVKMNVAEIYVVSLRAARLIEVTDSKVISLEAHTTDVGSFFEKGLVSRNDLLAAQVALADSRQQAMQAHNMLQVAYAAYNRALGRDLSSPVNLADLQIRGAPADVDELTRQALQTRPEIAGLSAQARALREQAAGVQAKKGPQVALEGGYLYQQNQSIDPNGLAAVMLGVEWTPMDSGRISHQASALSEKAEAVIRIRKDTESMIALEVRQKWLDLQTALERIKVTQQATAQADDNLRVARDRYQNQVGTNTEVLDAETLRVQAYTNFYNSTYETVLAELRLRRAVGNL